jgi:hypothetical protein
MQDMNNACRQHGYCSMNLAGVQLGRDRAHTAALEDLAD